MKKLLLLFVAATLSLSVFAQRKTVPDFKARDCHGDSVHLYSILDRGQYVLIDFYYKGCHPCNIIAPRVVEAYKALGCNKHDVFFMEITPYDNDQVCLAWCEQYGVEFPTISTEGGSNPITNWYQISGFPTVVLIAPDRTLVEDDIWPIPSAQTIIDKLNTYGIEEKDCAADPVQVLQAPELVAKEGANGFVELSWTSVDDEVFYFLTREGVEEPIAMTAELSYIDSLEMVPGNEYCYTVIATKEGLGNSPNSNKACQKCTVGIADGEQVMKFDVYPNPAKEYVTISVENMRKISIFNMLGAVVFEEDFRGNEITISTVEYQPGLYFVQVLSLNNKLNRSTFIVK